MMKVIFKGLGPTGNVVYEDGGKTKIAENGAIVELHKDVAMTYINLGLAYEVVDEKAAKREQAHILKMNETRKAVEKKAAKQGAAKKGGKK